MTTGTLSALPTDERLLGHPFARMNGAGNRITVLDMRSSAVVPSAAEVLSIAGLPELSFDQLMVIHKPRGSDSDAFISIFNTDGSSAGACGNGARCVAWYLAREGGSAFTLATSAGHILCRVMGPRRVTVDMGVPRFTRPEIPTIAADPGHVRLGLEADARFGPAFALSMGNPHAVFFVPSDVDLLDLAALGQPVEHAPEFPERVNVSFAQVIHSDAIKLRVWERGAGATLACGTGACAALVAAASTGRTKRAVSVTLPGGSLDIVWAADDHVVMSGDVELEFEGVLGGSNEVKAA